MSGTPVLLATLKRKKFHYSKINFVKIKYLSDNNRNYSPVSNDLASSILAKITRQNSQNQGDNGQR